ncbi:hypothetical protein C8R45DRAFT_1012726 [Mycena sanguinolenta]|nr:hypothetical protein C8R45DRAFT_1012726 [Mycena sanguinolenta]
MRGRPNYILILAIVPSLVTVPPVASGLCLHHHPLRRTCHTSARRHSFPDSSASPLAARRAAIAYDTARICSCMDGETHKQRHDTPANKRPRRRRGGRGSQKGERRCKRGWHVEEPQ